MSNARHMTVDDFMALPWEPLVEKSPGGGWRLTVPPLTDFEFFAQYKNEAMDDWKVALKTHLAAYLAAGKTIPLPEFDPPVLEGEHTFVIGWRLNQVA